MRKKQLRKRGYDNTFHILERYHTDRDQNLFSTVSEHKAEKKGFKAEGDKFQ